MKRRAARLSLGRRVFAVEIEGLLHQGARILYVLMGVVDAMLRVPRRHLVLPRIGLPVLRRACMRRRIKRRGSLNHLAESVDERGLAAAARTTTERENSPA